MNKEKINARIVADSRSPQGKRITTYLLTYPRSIHSELMTHRLFSRNAASSRAIPFSKMLDQIENDPFIPIAWQKKHSGMQGNDYNEEPSRLIETWLSARDEAVKHAKRLDLQNATKQVVNRLIEPWVWYHVLVTATEYDNFFKLRSPDYTFHDEGSEYHFKSRKDVIKHFGENEIVEGSFNKQLKDLTDLDWTRLSYSGAEIHIQALAESMWDAKNDSTPIALKAGEWHIPFGGKMDTGKLMDSYHNLKTEDDIVPKGGLYLDDLKLKIATARCARLSYDNFDGEIDYQKDMELHDRLLSSGHMSPFEHCAKAMNFSECESFINGKAEMKTQFNGNGEPTFDAYSFNKDAEGWCMNFNGFIPYRYIIENHKSRK